MARWLTLTSLLVTSSLLPSKEPRAAPPTRTAVAEDGVSQSEIVVGMSAALSGNSRNLGTDLKRGLDAAFEFENAAGGVHGRRLRLSLRDDGYDPDRAGVNVHAFVDEERVFALIGSTGTPTAAVSVPIVSAAGVPFFGAFTGAALLRKSPPDHWVLNVRASYAEETAALVRGFVDELGLKPEQLAFFTQSDAYGDAGYEGAVRALEARGYTSARRLPHARYPRNTLDVEGGLAELLDPTLDVRAVIMVGTAAPCAKFIKLAHQHRLPARFANVSFVGSEALSAALGPEGEGVVVSQVMPPEDLDTPLLRDYRAAIPATERTFVVLEGFVTGRLFAHVARRAGPKLSREAFVRAFEAGAHDIGFGAPLQPSATDHQASHQVWMTVLRGGAFRQLTSFRALRPG